jgi:hypothetical protein
MVSARFGQIGKRCPGAERTVTLDLRNIDRLDGISGQVVPARYVDASSYEDSAVSKERLRKGRCLGPCAEGAIVIHRGVVNRGRCGSLVVQSAEDINMTVAGYEGIELVREDGGGNPRFAGSTVVVVQDATANSPVALSRRLYKRHPCSMLCRLSSLLPLLYSRQERKGSSSWSPSKRALKRPRKALIATGSVVVAADHVIVDG